ncbi:hypothetical protein [Actinoplanes utahensis]|uniref:Uncharacterized protein n=1 Tax=Actinoplanes utahensis TaxID=1869 RepID=A0A0A6UDZ4_ACTUT|nr:hypothetical protein [Actinoplanes utahensis]KHD74250.1 hypothetical protein MB27_29965 [Actinoplanes utahensis]GIF35484.1 hypothetical protein Aut01nite_84700 [Actinoplanes utahensis]
MAIEPSQDAQRIAESMRHTAEELECAEETLHRSASASPDQRTAERLDRLGDAVTAEARAIARRAGNLAGPARTEPSSSPPEQRR